MAGIKCSRCGLFSPDTAQRCNCGYDFETQTVQKAYFKQGTPATIQGLSYMKPSKYPEGWDEARVQRVRMFALTESDLGLSIRSARGESRVLR